MPPSKQPAETFKVVRKAGAQLMRGHSLPKSVVVVVAPAAKKWIEWRHNLRHRSTTSENGCGAARDGL